MPKFLSKLIPTIVILTVIFSIWFGSDFQSSAEVDTNDDRIKRNEEIEEILKNYVPDRYRSIRVEDFKQL